MEAFDWEDTGEEGVKLARFAGGPDNHFVGTGVAYAHPQPDEPQGFCVATLQFAIPENAAWAAGPQWAVDSYDPLSLNGSVLCTAHRDWHGFITLGRWIRANGVGNG